MEGRRDNLQRARCLVVLLFVSFLYACITTAPFSETAYEQATSLKVESLQLMDKATESYGVHEKAVNELMTKVEKAYEYAKGRPHNEISAQQWAMMKDPDRNLLGGFIRFWKEKVILSTTFVKDHKKNVAEGFDYIIEMESGKIKGKTSK
jgi:hypothetical protein